MGFLISASKNRAQVFCGLFCPFLDNKIVPQFWHAIFVKICFIWKPYGEERREIHQYKNFWVDRLASSVHVDKKEGRCVLHFFLIFPFQRDCCRRLANSDFFINWNMAIRPSIKGTLALDFWAVVFSWIYSNILCPWATPQNFFEIFLVFAEIFTK